MKFDFVFTYIEAGVCSLFTVECINKICLLYFVLSTIQNIFLKMEYEFVSFDNYLKFVTELWFVWQEIVSICLLHQTLKHNSTKTLRRKFSIFRCPNFKLVQCKTRFTCTLYAAPLKHLYYNSEVCVCLSVCLCRFYLKTVNGNDLILFATWRNSSGFKILTKFLWHYLNWVIR